jgi:hypothetical protein
LRCSPKTLIQASRNCKNDLRESQSKLLELEKKCQESQTNFRNPPSPRVIELELTRVQQVLDDCDKAYKQLQVDYNELDSYIEQRCAGTQVNQQYQYQPQQQSQYLSIDSGGLARYEAGYNPENNLPTSHLVQVSNLEEQNRQSNSFVNILKEKIGQLKYPREQLNGFSFNTASENICETALKLAIESSTECAKQTAETMKEAAQQASARTRAESILESVKEKLEKCTADSSTYIRLVTSKDGVKWNDLLFSMLNGSLTEILANLLFVPGQYANPKSEFWNGKAPSGFFNVYYRISCLLLAVSCYSFFTLIVGSFLVLIWVIVATIKEWINDKLIDLQGKRNIKKADYQRRSLEEEVNLQRLKYLKEQQYQQFLLDGPQAQPQSRWRYPAWPSFSPEAAARREQYQREAEATQQEIQEHQKKIEELKKRRQQVIESQGEDPWDTPRGGAIETLQLDPEIAASDFELAQAYALLAQLEEIENQLVLYCDPVFFHIRLHKLSQSLNLNIQELKEYGIPLDLRFLGFDISFYIGGTEVENEVTLNVSNTTKVGKRLGMSRKDRIKKLLDRFTEGLGWVTIIKLLEMTANPATSFSTVSSTISPRPMHTTFGATPIAHESSVQRPEDMESRKRIEEKLREGNTGGLVRIQIGDRIMMVYDKTLKRDPIEIEADARREEYAETLFHPSKEALKDFEWKELNETSFRQQLEILDKQKAEFFGRVPVSKNYEKLTKSQAKHSYGPLSGRTKTLNDLGIASDMRSQSSTESSSNLAKSLKVVGQRIWLPLQKSTKPD